MCCCSEKIDKDDPAGEGRGSKPSPVDKNRRLFLTALGTAVVGIGVGYALGYLTKPAEVIRETIERTVTVTRTTTVTVAPTPTPTVIPGLSGAASRAIAGVRDLLNRGVIAPGTTIRILHVAGSRANLEKAIELWSRYVPEVKVELITLGTEPDVYTKAMSEAVTKTGAFDAVTIFSTWLGDIVEAGLARSLDDFYAKYDPEYVGPCAPIEPLGSYVTTYKGRRYSLALDSDVFTLSYRKDLLTNETYRREFEAQYRKPLKVPDTWEELIDMAKFFTELRLTAPSGGRVWGAYFYLEPAFAAYITWFNIFVEAGGIPFDLETMDPKVDTPEGRYAFDIILKLKPYMPPEAISAAWADLYDKFVKGETVFTAAWPSLTKEAMRPTSAVRGNVGTALMPGVEIEVGGRKVVNKAAPNPVNWVGIVSNYSANPEVAYLFLQFATAPDTGLDMVLTGVILDLFRACWFTDPTYRAKSAEGYGEEFLDAYMESIKISYPDILIRGGTEYLSKLTTEVNNVAAGLKDPERALSDVSAEWDSITKKYGRDAQLGAWRALAQLFPENVKNVWKAKGYMK
ncbi:MAG: extracellular solute-binding protein [Ignisphaera sp.]|uniref:Extracellular solute-binding protein n=1 Tax=Ignisphaera aggregans TaxID=334771 RepID=A0A7J3JRY5_9CREN